MPELNEAQRKAWPFAVAEAQRRMDTTHLHENPDDSSWVIDYEEEFRPGRGHRITAIWMDPDFLVVFRGGTYGDFDVSVASVRVLHVSTDDECDCEPCVEERDHEE